MGLQEFARMTDEYRKRVKIRKRGGLWMAECPNGLWKVEAANRKAADWEAWRYWQQYYQDGEYS